MHEQLYLGAVKKLEALSEMIRKIHDLKKHLQDNPEKHP